MSNSWDPVDYRPPGPFPCLWDYPVKNTGGGCHFLLLGIFPTQELNPGLLHCRQILYRLSYKGSLVVYSGSKPDIERLKSKLLWRACFIYWKKNLIISYKVLKSSREPCTPRQAQRPLHVPCLLFIEELKSPSLPLRHKRAASST